MGLTAAIPPPPKGFVLDDETSGGIPPPPKGFVLDADTDSSVPVTMNQRRPAWSGSVPPEARSNFDFSTAPPKAQIVKGKENALDLVEAAATGTGGGEAVPESVMPALAAANKVAQIPGKIAAPVGKLGAQVAAETVFGGGRPQATGRLALGPNQPYDLAAEQKAEAEHPVTAGIVRGVGEVAGSTAANPTNWPFFASAAARPLLQQFITQGFRLGLGAGAVEGAKTLYTHWDQLSPEQRAEMGTQTGLSALLAGGAGAIQEHLRGNYDATPKGPESVFRSIVYNHTGADLPPEPTLEQAAAAHRAAAFNLHPDVNASHIEDMKNLNQAWDLYKQTLQAAPPPPMPRQPGEPPLALPGQPAPMHAISLEEIAEMGDKIAKLPVEERPQATLAAHTALATELLNQGKLTIDGKVEIVRNQKQAETLAQRLINEEIGRQDAQSKKAASEPVPAPPAGFVIDESPKEEGQPAQTFAVGDRVVLPKGDTGTVAHANSRLIRVALDGGGKASVPAEKWGQVERAPVESANVPQSRSDVSGGQGRPETSGLPQSSAQPSVAGGVASPLSDVHGNPVVAPDRGTARDGEAAAHVPGDILPRGAPTAVEAAAKADVSKGQIIFARHGETKLDQAGANETVAGWTKEPLDDRGKASAAKLADEIKDQKPTVIVTSDLPRAKETAEIVGKKLGIPVKEDARLRPQHVPETEGLKVGEATPIWNDYEKNADKQPQGGESWNQARERQDAALKDVESLVAKGEKPVVMTHSRNLEMELGEKPKPGGFITRSGGEKGGANEPGKVESGNGKSNDRGPHRPDSEAVQREPRGATPPTVKLSELPDEERAKIERMKVVLGPYWHEPRELWARMFEQYIATKLGKGSLAAESPERYQNTPAWWTSAAWAKIEPLFEQALKTRMDAMRERYAPETIKGESAAEPSPPPTVQGSSAPDTPSWSAGAKPEVKKLATEAEVDEMVAEAKPATLSPMAEAGKALSDKWKQEDAERGAVKVAAGVVKTEEAPPEPTKAEKIFIGDLKKRVEALRDRQDVLLKDTAGLAATFQDSAKQAAYRDERSRKIKDLSEVESELKDIYAEHKWELARELKPPDMATLPDAAKNKHAFYREYFTQSLQPALDAWKEHLGPKFANAAKNGMKNTGMPAAFPEKQLFVNIPGDGKFLVNNDPKVLTNVLKGAPRGFAKPGPDASVEAAKPPKQWKMPPQSEASKWNYLDRMADEAVDAHTQEEKDAALETIENLLGFTPLKELPKPGSRLEYRGQEFFANGWEKPYRKTVNIVPVDTPGLAKWIEDGMPKLTTAEAAVMADRARDAEEPVSLYLLKPIGKVKTIAPEKEVGLARVLRSESGELDVSRLGEVARNEFEQEIFPGLEKAKLNLSQAFRGLQHLIAPRAGIPIRTLDSAMRLTGQREQHRWILEQTLEKSAKIFDKLGREPGIAFIDAYKTGERQPTPELNELSEFMRKTDEATYRTLVETQVANLGPKAQTLWKAMPEDAKTAFLHKIADFKGDETLEKGPLKELAEALLNYKDDHFRVLWEKVPGKPEISGARGVKGRRPLEGSKGFLKQATLATMSEGLERGGEPVTYNPVRMFEVAQADAWRYITAQQMWRDAYLDGGRVFVKAGQPKPEGFDFIDDKIGSVRFPAASGEGMVQAGKWALREDWHRLLSNMLSHDYIRESVVGNGLMNIKNQLTGYRLSLSPFHAITTTVSSLASHIGHGLEEANYGLRGMSGRHLVEAAKAFITTPFAPVSDYRLGTLTTKYASSPEEFLKTMRGQDFVQKYPEAAQLIDDLFAAGAKLSLHEDERLHSIEGVRQAIAEDHYLAALIKSPFALNQLLMRPLFGYYIPRIKVGTWLRDYSMALEDHADDIDNGSMTRGELARKTWDTTENIFGQMNWDARWWHRTFKAAIQFAFRAFTWFAGNLRLVKDAGLGQTREGWESAKWWYEKMGGEGVVPEHTSTGPIPRLDPSFGKLVGLAMTYFLVNAAIQYARTKELPKDFKDLMAARIGGVDNYGHPLRVVPPAIVMKDALSLWAHGGWGYLKAKESDLLSGISDVVANEDFRHAMVHNPKDAWWKQRYDDAAHVLGSPIGISTYGRQKKEGETPAKAAFGLAGFSPAPQKLDESPLERHLHEIQEEKGYGPPASPQQRAKTDLEHAILGALRSHNRTPLNEAVAQKKINPTERQKLEKRARLSPLEDSVTHLSIADVQELLETKGITDKEKRDLHHILAQKQARARYSWQTSPAAAEAVAP